MIKHSRILYTFICAATILLAAGCNTEKQQVTKKPVQVDSTAIKDSLAKAAEENLVITYHYFPDSGKISYTALKEKFSSEELKVILAVNRLDAKNFWRRDSVVVPDTFVANYLKYSPFPLRIDAVNQVKKLIFFSYPAEVYAAYEYGKLVRWGPSSLGKKSKQTPEGLLHTNWKAKTTVSTINSEWILPWAFNLDNFEGVSMHEYDLPGYPASHACCRLWSEDAQWFYYWAEQWIVSKDRESVVAYGTPVIIFGKYNWGHKPIWHFLPQNSDTTTVTADVIDSLTQMYLGTILQQQSHRDSIVAEREKQKELEIAQKGSKESK